MTTTMTDRAVHAQRPGFRMRRRAFVGALAATLLAGCSTVVPKGEERPTVAPPAPAGPSANQGLPEDRERHRIALLVPLSGANAGVGQSLANAANLALLDTGGRGLRMTIYDTSTGAAAAANKAVAEGNGLILGPLLGPDVKAVAPIAARAGVPVLAFSNDTSAAGDGTYLLGFAPTQSIDRVVAYTVSQGMKRIAGLVPAGVYGQRASTSILRSVDAAGGSVVSMQTYERTPTSLAAAIKKLGTGYDAVMIADSGRIAIQAAPAIKKTGAKLLGTELWNAEPTLGTVLAMQGAWFASGSDRFYGQFATKYRARFGKSPFRLASLGYDAVLLAARIAPDWKMGDAFPQGRLRDRGGFAGVDGAFRFGRDGLAERALEVYQIGPGGFTSVSAATAGF
jgi:branched-chain amino acid transport system substrate-binding protein